MLLGSKDVFMFSSTAFLHFFVRIPFARVYFYNECHWQTFIIINKQAHRFISWRKKYRRNYTIFGERD